MEVAAEQGMLLKLFAESAVSDRKSMELHCHACFLESLDIRFRQSSGLSKPDFWSAIAFAWSQLQDP